eukprot:4353125-Pyramimonas_sp.AAC.1
MAWSRQPFHPADSTPTRKGAFAGLLAELPGPWIARSKLDAKWGRTCVRSVKLLRIRSIIGR